ncbi:hypothetical protein MUB24_22280 [Lederbergia sp. NSJ-179]|uniref:hypothetical protein n=1 Tax=Lederbergia sp. NSJ-179 TaxID=2931402 RepID=UPI001FD07266|nr:hypothetical protein [Lederbergia sp. NSJ-179]MCJ7843551.1 hypothetical protein [Lederbergia sp. NSJ-179]
MAYANRNSSPPYRWATPFTRLKRETSFGITLNQGAATASEGEKEKIKEEFVIAKEYKLAFWEMAYTGEKWLSEETHKVYSS